MTEKLVSLLVEKYNSKHSEGVDSTLGWDTSYPLWIICGFPHSLQTVAGIVSELCHDSFLLKPFRVPYSPTLLLGVSDTDRIVK